MNATRRVLAFVVLVATCGLLASCGPAQATVAPSPMTTATPTPTIAVSQTPSSTETALSMLVGKWERHGTQDGKPYTERFALSPDGTYSIEARFDSPDAPLASSHGTWASTQTTLTLTDQDAKTTVAPYYLDSSGKLVIDNDPASAWTRVQ